MHTAQFYTIFFALIVRICLSEIVVHQPKAEKASYLGEALVNVLTNCYANDSKAVVFAGDTSDALIKNLRSKKPIPIVLINNTTRIVHNSLFLRRTTHKLHEFVITATSTKQIDTLIREIKETIWWNHFGYFIIIDQSSLADNDCSNVSKLLYKAWNHNMIRAKVMCRHRTKGLLFYSYNPYTSHVPNRWQLDRIYTGKNFHPYTVFVREYRNGDGICEDLDFDMPNKLDGYRLTTLRPKTLPTKHLGKRINTHAYYTVNRHVVKMLYFALNLTQEIRLYRLWHLSVDYRLSDCICEMPMQIQHGKNTVLHSYPIRRDGMGVMSQFRGHMTQLEKILAILDVYTWIGLGLVFLLTLTFFTYFQSLMPATLNVIRIVCNTGFMNIPKQDAPRIYLAGILFLAVTMHGIYAGQIAALLTQVVPLPDPNTIQDLVDMNYTVYIFRLQSPFLNKSIFSDRLVETNSADCSEYVLRDPSAACLSYLDLITDQATNLKLHIVGESAIEYYLAHQLPTDTPIEDKINKIFVTLLETALILPLEMRWIKKDIAEFAFDETVKNNEAHRAMTLADLGFAFAIYGIGLTVAIIAFIVEMVIDRIRSRIRTGRISRFQFPVSMAI